MTIESFNFQKTGPDTAMLKADVTATIYLSPASEGETAGATAQGPGTAPGAAPAPSSSPGTGSPSSPTPTAVATP
jgi:hypothetical protein